MIASSLREGDQVVDLMLNKGTDVNCKSEPYRFSQMQKGSKLPMLITYKIMLARLAIS